MQQKQFNLKILILVVFIIHGFVFNLSANEIQNTKASEHKKKAEKESFKPGDFIFEHIEDSHDWPIFTVGEKHINIPLPVIIYSKEKGLNIFMSSKFQHGHDEYKGFRLETEGENKGLIVEVLQDGSTILPFDISITKNIASLFIGIALLLWIFLSIAKAYKNNPNKAPKGIQSAFEPIIIFIRDEVAKSSIGEKKHEKFMPFLLTVFFFIWINNMLGLIPFFPGGANLTGNIAVTLVLALFTFLITTINGNKNYWKHIFNTPGVPTFLKLPIPLMPVIEFIGILTKPFVLMVRLFANITAGHIIGLGFLSLIFIFGQMNVFLGYGVSVLSVAFVIFMTFLELLVAFIQAYVFTFLSALYIGMAVEEHH
ncbi:MAG: F0F1 ATP synthase subunit A [Bacteroidales bacterium]|nr:F0F1 ATP synthase subunit A [Bacteroidales bacterium]